MVAFPPTTEFSFNGSNLPLETVTIFRPSGAQIIRKLDIDLKAGNNVIAVANLSTFTETESFRVDGLGNARLLVVRCALDQRPEIITSDPIRELNSQLKELQAEKSAREQEVAILTAFGKTMAGKPDLSPDQAKAFSDTLFDKIIAGAEAVRDLDEKITRMYRKIDQTRAAKSGTACTNAFITILADEDGPAQLRLIYRVLSPRWEPLYDLHATSDDEKPSTSVSLHYRVRISQNTGEDWTNAKLILSTSATDVLDAGIPRPDDLIIKPPTPPPPPSPQRKSRSAVYIPSSPVFSLKSPTFSPTSPGYDPEGSVEYNDDMAFDYSDEPSTAMALLPQLTQSAAAISKSPMMISYTVETLTTIPSDGVLYRVLVAVVPFEAVITHITTPSKSPIAYLQCAVKNTSEYYLIPGLMSVFLDNSYVSKTKISEVATGDTFNCTLGMDTSIRVSRELTQFSVTSPPSSFMEQYTTTTYMSTTKLHNRHTGDYPVNIIERSSIPIASASDPRIKVFLKEPTGLAESEDGKEVDLGRKDGFMVKWGRDLEDTKNGQKGGKFIWYGTISPGEEVVLVSEWDVRAPVDAEWRVKSK